MVERTLAPYESLIENAKRVVFRNSEYLEALKDALLTVVLTETDQYVSEHFLRRI